MKFDIITIFPHIFDSYFNESILARARKNKLIQINVHNLRDYTADKSRSRSDRGSSTKWSGHRSVDDSPYGGGPGMVLMAEPILKAVEKATSDPTTPRLRGAGQRPATRKIKVIVFSAKGKQFDQKMAYDWSRKLDRIVLVCGRYEGIDERVVKILKAEEVSIGPYVLTDGEVPAMAVVAAVARLIPGVIKLESLAEESHWSRLVKREGRGKKGDKGGGLEYPHYTRPEVLEYKGKKYRVPKVLMSGDHKKIEEWRKSRTKTPA